MEKTNEAKSMCILYKAERDKKKKKKREGFKKPDSLRYRNIRKLSSTEVMEAML